MLRTASQVFNRSGQIDYQFSRAAGTVYEGGQSSTDSLSSVVCYNKVKLTAAFAFSAHDDTWAYTA